MDENNPYQSPVGSEPPPPPVGPRGRWAWLLLPPAIPPMVHGIVHLFLPPQEDVAHLLFLGLAVMIAWGWSLTMVDRLRLSFVRAYLLNVAVACAVVVSALLTIAVRLRQ